MGLCIAVVPLSYVWAEDGDNKCRKVVVAWRRLRRLWSSALTHTYDSGNSAMHRPIRPSCNTNISLPFPRKTMRARRQATHHQPMLDHFSSFVTSPLILLGFGSLGKRIIRLPFGSTI